MSDIDPKTFQKFSTNVAWFMAHYNEIKDKHRGEFVAVDGGIVMDHDQDLDRLKKRVEDKDWVFKKYIPLHDDLILV
jgi:hypothetical protein